MILRREQVKISGYWLEYEEDENIILDIDYRLIDEGGFDPSFSYNNSNGIEIIKITNAYGEKTNRDYSDELRLSPNLLEHLEDSIYERLEV